MVTNLTTTKEVFNEFEIIKDNVKTFSIYNTYITVETVRNGFTASKPETYTFSTLNLLKLFGNMLTNCKLQATNWNTKSNGYGLQY